MSSILMLSNKRRYFLYRGKADMRRGFDGLSQLVREEMDGTLMQENMFIFLNKGRTHIKLLVWEEGGVHYSTGGWSRGRLKCRNITNRRRVYP